MIATILTALLAGSPMKEFNTTALQAAMEQAKANGYKIVTQIDTTDETWKNILADLGIDPECIINYPLFQFPGCQLPDIETPETESPETEVPGTDTPDTPETEAPGIPETEMPETEAPSVPETEAPSIPETEVPDTPTPPETEAPETETPETEAPGQSSSMAKQVADLVNQERAKAGLAPLTLREDLTQAAQIRAKESAVSFSHTRPDGSGFQTVLTQQQISYRRSGENIAWGQPTAQSVMNAWMNSPGHRANILNSSFEYIGVGYYTSSQGTPYWAQLFISD